MSAFQDDTLWLDQSLSPFEFQYSKVDKLLYLDRDESDTNISLLNEFMPTSPNYIHGLPMSPQMDTFDFIEQSAIVWPQDCIEKVNYVNSDSDENISREEDENMEYLLKHLQQMRNYLTNIISEINENIMGIDGNYQISGLTSEKKLVLDFLSILQKLSHYTITHTVQSSLYTFPCTSNDLSTIHNQETSLPNHNVILMKWPESIGQLWEEYVKCPLEWSQAHINSFLVNLNKMGFNSFEKETILERTISIAELELQFGSSWRYKDKNFSRQINRRKKIWNSIEKGLKDGLTLKECIWILEKYAQDNKEPLSFYYRGVPFSLSRARTLYL